MNSMKVTFIDDWSNIPTLEFHKSIIVGKWLFSPSSVYQKMENLSATVHPPPSPTHLKCSSYAPLLQTTQIQVIGPCNYQASVLVISPLPQDILFWSWKVEIAHNLYCMYKDLAFMWAGNLNQSRIRWENPGASQGDKDYIKSFKPLSFMESKC